MKHYTKEEISAIRADINNGAVYCGISNCRGTGVIQRTISGNIGWQHYGSSANKNTDRNLRWILKTIFEDCDEAVPAKWSDYHMNYVPIDSEYIGVDMSRSHPNVCGL